MTAADVLGRQAEDRFEVRRRWASKQELHGAIADHLRSTRRQEKAGSKRVRARDISPPPPFVSRRRWAQGGAALVYGVALLVAVLLYLLISRKS